MHFKTKFYLDYFSFWSFRFIALWASVLCSFDPSLQTFGIKEHQKKKGTERGTLPLRALSSEGGEKWPQLFSREQMRVVRLEPCFFLLPSLQSSCVRVENPARSLRRQGSVGGSCGTWQSSLLWMEAAVRRKLLEVLSHCQAWGKGRWSTSAISCQLFQVLALLWCSPRPLFSWESLALLRHLFHYFSCNF